MSNGSSPSVLGGEKRAGWVELDSGEAVELASARHRGRARSLDVLFMAVIAVVLFFVLFAIFWTESVPPDDVGTVSIGFTGMLVSILVAVIGYEVVQVAIWGRTLGKRIVGIRVISAVDGGVPGWAKSFLRCAIAISSWLMAALLLRVLSGFSDRVFGTDYVILVALLGVSIVWGLMARQRQRREYPDGVTQRPDDALVGFPNWHDRVAGTLVVTQASSNGEFRWPRSAQRVA